MLGTVVGLCGASLFALGIRHTKKFIKKKEQELQEGFSVYTVE